jgi:hypothetical protein
MSPTRALQETQHSLIHLCLQTFRGALHLVQMVEFEHIVDRATRPTNAVLGKITGALKRFIPIPTAASSDASDGGVLLMRAPAPAKDNNVSKADPDHDLDRLVLLEYARHGSLMDIISKFDRNSIRFTNRALWNIFECLIRALCGMENPPSRYPNFARRGSRDVPLYTENPPPFNSDRTTNYVHFDIDVQNGRGKVFFYWQHGHQLLTQAFSYTVLVFEFDNGAHTCMPLMKVTSPALVALHAYEISFTSMDVYISTTFSELAKTYHACACRYRILASRWITKKREGEFSSPREHSQDEDAVDSFSSPVFFFSFLPI